MSLAEAQPHSPVARESPGRGIWSRRRWFTLIALVFAAHVALLFVFGAHQPVVPRPVTNVPSLALADDASESLGLSDPTLLARPHPEGFAGPAWLEPPRLLEFHRQDWTEPPRWLKLSTNELAGVFGQWMQTNHFLAVQLELRPQPELNLHPLPPPTMPAAVSTLQVEGDLARRQWPGTIHLPPVPAADVIAPSQVQVLVDAAGNVVSAVLLPSDNTLEAASRYADADQLAIAIAQAIRFEPLPDADISVAADRSSALALGRLIFRWATVPVTSTNEPGH